MRLMQKLVLVALLIAAVSVPASTQASPCDDRSVRSEVCLLEPLGNNPSIPIAPYIGTFLNYFNDATAWIFEVAVGFTVVWVLIAGFQFMISGNNQSMRTEAISRITWAIGGLLMLLFAGFLLRLLNNIFFTP